MNAPIAIVGAGPSGLMLACLLEQANIDYIVYDRDATPAVEGQGGSLDIHANSGQLALKEAGLLDEFKKLARYEDQQTTAVDKHGDLIMCRTGDGSEDKPEIDRKVLRDMLLRAIPGDRIHWGHRVESTFMNESQKVIIRFTNGTETAAFKLVVGADGAWSKVRHLLTDACPQYSGLSYIQTTISIDNPHYSVVNKEVGRGTYVGLGSGKQLAAQRLGDGSYNIYAGLRIPEHWKREHLATDDSGKSVKHLITDEFEDWAPRLVDWVVHGDGKFHVWPLYAMPVASLSWTSRPGVTLIGDAAHVSTPFVGEGVNCSMFDSLQLFQAIKRHGMGDLEDAVSEYEKKMFTRAIDLITRSAKSGKSLFHQNSAQLFRNMIAGGKPLED